MDVSTANLVGSVLVSLATGGALVKLIEWARSRSDAKAKQAETHTVKSAEIAIREIDSELTVNERLLQRLSTIENRMDRQTEEHKREIAECENRSAKIERESEVRYQTLLAQNKTRDELREKRERELMDANRLLLYSYENIRSDMTSLRRHVDRVEDENRRLRSELRKEG